MWKEGFIIGFFILFLCSLTGSSQWKDSDSDLQSVVGNSRWQQAEIAGVVFSNERGIYYDEFTLSLTCSNPGATIRYTLDGSLPSSQYGFLYTHPIQISRTSIIRAMATIEGPDSSGVATCTYLFPEQVVRQGSSPSYADGTPFPEDWDGVASDYEMDPEVISLEGAEKVKRALLAIPSLSIVMDDNDLFQKIMNGGGKSDNDGLESPASMEMLYPETPQNNIQIDCGFGPRSRNLEDRAIKRGFEVIFKKIFGPGKLEFPVFFDAPLNGESAVHAFDNLVLRPGFCDTWSSKGYNDSQDTYTRDPMTREAYQEVSGMGTHNHFVHLYLNGLYWGLFNLTEKVNENFVKAYLGGKDEDWLLVKSHTDSDDDGDVTNGDDTRYQQLLDLVGGDEVHGPLRSLYQDSDYQLVCSLIDPLTYAQYIMVHCYHGPGDWPDNNWYFIMRNNPPEPGFFQIWDAEKSLANYAGDGREHAWYTPLLTETDTRGGQAVPSRIWKAMLTNPDFRLLFADEVYRSLLKADGALTNAHSIERWNNLNNFLGAEDREHAAIIGESARWGDVNIDNSIVKPARYDHWMVPVNSVVSHLQTNVTKFYEEFAGLLDQPKAPVISVDEEPEYFSSYLASGPYKITLANPGGSGTIYYRIDELDPRVSGGSDRGHVREGSMAYSEDLFFNHSINLRARVLLNGRWSPLNFLDVSSTSGEPDLFIREEALIYPNPFRDILYLKVPSSYPDGNYLEIYSMTGNLVWSEECHSGTTGLLEIVPPHFEPGCYLFMLRAADRSVLVRERLIRTD